MAELPAPPKIWTTENPQTSMAQGHVIIASQHTKLESGGWGRIARLFGGKSEPEQLTTQARPVETALTTQVTPTFVSTSSAESGNSIISTLQDATSDSTLTNDSGLKTPELDSANTQEIPVEEPEQFENSRPMVNAFNGDLDSVFDNLGLVGDIMFSEKASQEASEEVLKDDSPEEQERKKHRKSLEDLVQSWTSFVNGHGGAGNVLFDDTKDAQKLAEISNVDRDQRGWDLASKIAVLVNWASVEPNDLLITRLMSATKTEDQQRILEWIRKFSVQSDNPWAEKWRNQINGTKDSSLKLEEPSQITDEPVVNSFPPSELGRDVFGGKDNTTGSGFNASFQAAKEALANDNSDEAAPLFPNN